MESCNEEVDAEARGDETPRWSCGGRLEVEVDGDRDADPRKLKGSLEWTFTIRLTVTRI